MTLPRVSPESGGKNTVFPINRGRLRFYDEHGFEAVVTVAGYARYVSPGTSERTIFIMNGKRGSVPLGTYTLAHDFQHEYCKGRTPEFDRLQHISLWTSNGWTPILTEVGGLIEALRLTASILYHIDELLGDEGPVRCPDCGKMYGSEYELRQHREEEVMR